MCLQFIFLHLKKMQRHQTWLWLKLQVLTRWKMYLDAHQAPIYTLLVELHKCRSKNQILKVCWFVTQNWKDVMVKRIERLEHSVAISSKRTGSIDYWGNKQTVYRRRTPSTPQISYIRKDGLQTTRAAAHRTEAQRWRAANLHTQPCHQIPKWR